MVLKSSTRCRVRGVKPAAWQARTVICWHIVPGVAVIHGQSRQRPITAASAASSGPADAVASGAGEARYIASVHRAAVARPGSGPAATKSYSWISATSRSPARSASATSAGSISETIGSRPGCWRASAISAGRDHRAPGAGKGADAQRAGQALARAGQLGGGPLQLLQHRLGVPDQVPPGRGEHHPPPAALQQRQAGLPLQRAELLRDRRRGEGQRLGDGGDRAPVGQFAQQAQAADIKH